jgi:hypothetical protein
MLIMVRVTRVLIIIIMMGLELADSAIPIAPSAHGAEITIANSAHQSPITRRFTEVEKVT